MYAFAAEQTHPDNNSSVTVLKRKAFCILPWHCNNKGC